MLINNRYQEIKDQGLPTDLKKLDRTSRQIFRGKFEAQKIKSNPPCWDTKKICKQAVGENKQGKWQMTLRYYLRYLLRLLPPSIPRQ